MAASGGVPVVRGLDISLAALRRHDPYIQRILDVASQVALYTFSHQSNEWEKTDVEGALFVYSRSASPKHGFTIMNRLSMDNRTEPITKDLDFQLQDPFLLYRNARFCIFGIWFYDKEECQRIAELMKNLTQQEQLKEQAVNTGAPSTMFHSDGKNVDILQMLNKAKNEYAKSKPCSEPKAMTSYSAIHSNPNLIKPIAVKPSDKSQHVSSTQHSTQQNKSVDPEPQRLSLTTLFGKTEDTPVEESSKVRPTVVRSLSYEESHRLSESGEKQLCPAIQKLMVCGADLIPVTEIPENRPSQTGSIHAPGDVFSSLFRPIEEAAHFPAPELDRSESLLHKLTSTHSSVLHIEPGLTPSNPYYSGLKTSCTTSSPGKNTGRAPLHFYDGSQNSQTTPLNLHTMPFSSQLPHPPGTISPHELLKKLNIVRQDQQYQANSKPALAAKFPLVSQPAMKPNWVENVQLGDKPNPLLQAISPQLISTTVAPSILLSPMVFTQTNTQKKTDITKPTVSDNDTTANLLLPLSLTDLPTNVSNQSNVLTKSQLRDSLLHLIQNDENFLNTIYEAYLSVLNRRAAPTGML